MKTDRTGLRAFAAIVIASILAFTCLVCNNHPVMAVLLILVAGSISIKTRGDADDR